MIGMFSAEIFRKWKSVIVKQDESKKNELRELFRVIDEKKRGSIKAETIIRFKNLFSEIFMVDSDLEKFIDYIDKQYGETKISEAVFVKVVIAFINKLI